MIVAILCSRPKLTLLFLLLAAAALLYYHRSQFYTLVDGDSLPDMEYMRKFGRVSKLPLETDLVMMGRKELVYTYHSYLDNIDFLCHRKLRMGDIGDGGWEVCDDFAYRPFQPCIVYSFGINGDFSFDDDISKLYACNVYSFDPSMDTDSHNRSNKVHFYKIGISGSERFLPGGLLWTVKTFSEIKEMLNHQNETVDVVKMDIDLSEWLVLPDMLTTGELSTARQLLIEFHTSIGESAELYQKRLLILAEIEALGFRRFHTHKNPYGVPIKGDYPGERSVAYEVYFVNTNLARP